MSNAQAAGGGAGAALALALLTTCGGNGDDDAVIFEPVVDGGGPPGTDGSASRDGSSTSDGSIASDGGGGGARVLGPVTGFAILGGGFADEVACASGACYFAHMIDGTKQLVTGASALATMAGAPLNTVSVTINNGSVYLARCGASPSVHRFTIATSSWSQSCGNLRAPGYCGTGILGSDRAGTLFIYGTPPGGATALARCPIGASSTTAWIGVAMASNLSVSGAREAWAHDNGSNVFFSSETLLLQGSAAVATFTDAPLPAGARATSLASAPNGDVWAMGFTNTRANHAFRRSPGGGWTDVSDGLGQAQAVSWSALHVDGGGNVLALTHDDAGVHTLYKLAPGGSTWSIVVSGNGLPTDVGSVCTSMDVDGDGRAVVICGGQVFRSTP